VWFFKPRSIPSPTLRKWNETKSGNLIDKSRLLRSGFGVYFFASAYFAFNVYITVITILPPYQNASGQPLEVQGWYYIVAIGSVIISAIVYYFATIGLVDRDHPDRSILYLADVRPEIHQEPIHHPKFGFRKKVQVIVRPESRVSCPFRRVFPC
jgi:hypothetical protein